MSQLLNGSLEVGVRVVAMLAALYPTQADLTRIVLLDHVVLHSEDFEGGTRLHPATPGRVGELGVKRELVRKAIRLMGARGLLVRDATFDGIYYVASDAGPPFLAPIHAPTLARKTTRLQS